MLVLLLAVVAAVAALVLYRMAASVRQNGLTRDAVQRLLGRFEPAQAPVMPSHWIAWGLRASARGDVPTALFYLALVWSNGLFAYVVTAWLATRLYRRGYNRLTTGGDLRHKPGGHRLDALLEKLLFPLSPQMRLLIIKDFRTFRRDTAQWAQILIFF